MEFYQTNERSREKEKIESSDCIAIVGIVSDFFLVCYRLHSYLQS